MSIVSLSHNLSVNLLLIKHEMCSLQKKSERILTQHGLSGLPGTQQRIGTSTGMRQIKDARYWQSQLQIKMDEIRRETERLVREKTNMDREKSAKKTFDRRAKETTKELTGKHL